MKHRLNSFFWLAVFSVVVALSGLVGLTGETKWMVHDPQLGVVHQTRAGYCTLEDEGQAHFLKLGDELVMSGKKVTCKSYDGHPILIFGAAS